MILLVALAGLALLALPATAWAAFAAHDALQARLAEEWGESPQGLGLAGSGVVLGVYAYVHVLR